MNNLDQRISTDEKCPAPSQSPSKLYIISKAIPWVSIVIVALLVALIVFRVTSTPQETIVTEPAPTPQVTIATISTRISGASDLITAKMSYNGLLKSDDGDIPIINKKSFLMTYHATVSIGYDLSKADITVGEHSVVIKMPPLNDPDINVDTDSIAFFDLSSAIFNWTTKEDGIDAVSVAKQNILETPELEELKSEAKKQAELLLHQLLDDNIGERDLNVSFD